jgi:hypothetical protein
MKAPAGREGQPTTCHDHKIIPFLRYGILCRTAVGNDSHAGSHHAMSGSTRRRDTQRRRCACRGCGKQHGGLTLDSSGRAPIRLRPFTAPTLLRCLPDARHYLPGDVPLHSADAQTQTGRRGHGTLGPRLGRIIGPYPVFWGSALGEPGEQVRARIVPLWTGLKPASSLGFRCSRALPGTSSQNGGAS